MSGRTAAGTAARSSHRPPAHSCGLFPGYWYAMPGRSPGPRHRATGRVARRSRTPRRGRRGLIGMLLSIVVAVVIIIAIFAVYNQLTASASAAQTAVFVRQLAPQISSEYRGAYDGLTKEAAIRSGFIPYNWRNGNTITDPTGATVMIGASTNGRRFLITFDGGVPVQTCKAVLGAFKTDRTFRGVLFGSTNKGRDEVDTAAEINSACGASPRADFVLRFN